MTLTLTFYDAVDVAALPAATTRAFGYLDGAVTAGHYERVVARFPHALVVPFTVTGRTLAAKVADVERHDLTPEQGAAWCGEKLARRQAPTLYCALDAWADVRSAVAAAHLPPGPVSYLVAGYATPPDPTIPRGAVGHQYASGAFDTSAVRPRWPGVLPQPLGRWARYYTHHLTRRLDRLWTPPPAVDELLLAGLDDQLHRVGHL